MTSVFGSLDHPFPRDFGGGDPKKVEVDFVASCFGFLEGAGVGSAAEGGDRIAERNRKTLMLSN